MICPVCKKEVEISTERIKVEEGIKIHLIGTKGNKIERIEKNGNLTIIMRNVEKCDCGIKLPKTFTVETDNKNTNEPTISVETEWIDGEVIIPVK